MTTSVPPAFAERATFLAVTRRRGPVRYKDDVLADLAHGRTVLDIGCIDHSLGAVDALGDGWLHERLRQAAVELVGIDVLAAEAEELNARGYDIRVADAESFHLGRTFDLVVAGDIIEHLSNPGRFLDSVRRHMTPTSLLAVSTPNPFAIERTYDIARRGQVTAHPQHVAWMEPFVMYELLTRHGFAVCGFHWVRSRFTARGSTTRHRLLAACRNAAARVRPAWESDFVVIARPADR